MPHSASRARRATRAALAYAVLACAGLVLGACGDDEAADAGGDGRTTPATASRSGGVSIGMKDIRFVPESITAKVGQTIVWTNNEAIPHNVTATEGADFASETMRRDDTYEFTPAKAGRIRYVCTIHSGQNGEIEVTAG